MCNIKYHITLKEILDLSFEKSFLSDSIELNYSEGIISKSQSIGIEFEKIGNNDKVRLLKNSIKTFVYSSFDELRKSFLNQNFENIFVLRDSDVFSYISDTSYINFIENPSNIFKNIFSYKKFIAFLKEQEKEVEGTFFFIDSFSRDLRKIVLTSITEKGRVTIKYSSDLPKFNNEKDYSVGLEKFIKCFDDQNKSLIRFLKTSTINTVSLYDEENRFQSFFENLESIVDKALINFEVYLNELSIDKIKKDYDDIKSKYFTGLSDILSKLSQSILALPIAIATLLFAIEKVKDTAFYLYLLIVIILITTVYLSLLLKIHFRDLNYIYKVFFFDYNLLIENKFFIKYPQEKQMFEEIKSRIEDRVETLKLIIELYYWTLNTSNLFLVGLLLYFLHLKIDFIVIIGVLALICITLARNSVIIKNENEN